MYAFLTLALFKKNFAITVNRNIYMLNCYFYTKRNLFLAPTSRNWQLLITPKLKFNNKKQQLNMFMQLFGHDGIVEKLFGIFDIKVRIVPLTKSKQEGVKRTALYRALLCNAPPECVHCGVGYSKRKEKIVLSK